MSTLTRTRHSAPKRSFFSSDPRIQPYDFNSLRGRYIHIAAESPSAKRTFIILYGHHATLERIMPIAETLAAYGDVYMPDNPGFGGMDPSYKIGRTASLDFFADHLKHFIDTYVEPGRTLTILGISFGFQIAVEFARLYPEYHSRIENLISFAGFVSPTNLRMSLPMKTLFKYVLAKVGSTRLGAGFYDFVLNDYTITKIYRLTWKHNVKFDSIPREAVDEYIAGQAWLWRSSDHRTHARTGYDFFSVNELTGYRFDDVALLHVGIPRDHFLDNDSAVAGMQKMFRQADFFVLDLPNHGPLDMDSPDKIRAILPPSLLKPLASSRNQSAVLHSRSQSSV